MVTCVVARGPGFNLRYSLIIIISLGSSYVETNLWTCQNKSVWHHYIQMEIIFTCAAKAYNLNEGSLRSSLDGTWHRIGLDGRLSWTVGSLISVLKTRSDLARKQQGRLFKNRLGLKNRFLGVIEIFSTLRGSKRPKTDGQKKISISVCHFAFRAVGFNEKNTFAVKELKVGARKWERSATEWTTR